MHAEFVRAISEVATGSLVAAIWQGTLLAGLVALGLKLLPKTPASVRFAIWFSVFAAVIALPVLSIMDVGTAASVQRSPWLKLPESWSIGIAAIWLVSSAWRGISLVLGAVRVRALWRRATPVDLPDAAPLTAGRGAQICVSDEVDRPSVIGFFAPKILIPSWLLDRLTPEEIAHVVLHEAGHLGRADDWLNLVQKVGLVVFPLNPALVWIERRLCFERELACDERVLRATGTPKAYASCLTALAEHRMNRRSAALVMAALGRESELGQRVARILARGERMRPVQARLMMGAAVVALIAGAAGLERCPELVGFSGSAPQSVAIAARPSALALTSSQGFAAQSVVFKATEAPSSAVHAIAPVRAQLLVAHPKPMRPTRSQSADVNRVNSSPDAAVRVVRTMATRNAEQPPMRWIVTEWRAADGTTMVMTTFTRCMPHGGTAVPAEPETQDLRVEQHDDSPVFSPYAAVPVRGGWLVVQL